MTTTSLGTTGWSPWLWDALHMPARRAVYVWVLIALPIASTFAQYVAPPSITLKGQSLAILVWLGGTALATGLWIPYRRSVRWPWSSTVAAVLLGFGWLYQVVRAYGEGGAVNYSSFCVPLALMLLVLKPPACDDALTGVKVFGYGVVGAALAGLILDLMDLAPSGFVVGRNGYGRIPLISEVFMTDARWDGPFLHSNYAGMIGASVILTSLVLPSIHRWVLVTGGAAILLLSQSRTGAMALLIGLAVWFLTGPKVRNAHHRTAIQWAVSVVGLLGIAAYIRAFDSTLGTRTYAWQDFLRLWASEPMSGVGTPAVEDYFRQGVDREILVFTHAHNLLLDQGARYGVLLAGLTLMTLIFVGLSAFGRGTGSRPVRAGLFGFVAATALVEVPVNLAYVSVLTIPLLFILMLSVQRRADSGVRDHEQLGAAVDSSPRPRTRREDS